MILGYIRENNFDEIGNHLQLSSMKKNNVEKIFKEITPVTSKQQPELIKLFNFLRKDDVVYIQSFSKLAKNSMDLVAILDAFIKANVRVIAIDEEFDTSNEKSEIAINTIRSKANIYLNRRKGKQYKTHTVRDRAYKITYPDNWKKIYNLYKTREISANMAMELTKLKRTTFYKLKKEYEADFKKNKNDNILNVI